MTKLKLILGVVVFYIALCGANAAMPAAWPATPASAAQTSDKDPSGDLPNPDRPYYDLWGNYFTYDGKLIQASPCPYSDPISGQPNPYCHDNCQYPDRTTNSINGCDNSDPCDPANVKGGSGDCTEPTPTPTPVVTPKQCEGK